MNDQRKHSFVDFLAVVIKRRIFILKTTTIATLVAVVISVLIQPQYTATATILPPNLQQDALFSLLQGSVVSTLGGLSGFGSMLPGATTASDLFAAILESSRIRGTIISKYDLKKVFKTRTMDDTYKMLASITKVDVMPEGIISVAVTWYDKHLAADIANSFIEELDSFNTQTAMTTGKKYRIFIEQRLNENIDSLEEAENALKIFQEKHHTVALDAEIEGAIQAIADLKSEMILLEVQKAAIGSGNINNPHVRQINQQLRELRKQLARIEFGDTTVSEKGFGAGFAVPFAELPEVAIEYARLVRDVEVQSAIFEILTQQYEQAKIMELKDTPTVQVLDRASPPERKSRPKRARIVILVAIFSLVFSAIGALFLESFEQTKKHPEDYRKWVDMYDKIRNDIRSATNRVFGTLRIRKKP